MKILNLFIFIFSLSSGFAMEPKIVYGYVEKVTLVEKNLCVSAKLDTGAKSASLSAIHVEPFEKDGKQYMHFTVPSKRGDIEFSAEYLGKVKIKARVGENTHLSQPEPIKRPVVLLRLRIGTEERDIAVNLTNRKRFNYPLLLGRDAINAFNGLVDPGAVFKIKIDKAEQNEV